MEKRKLTTVKLGGSVVNPHQDLVFSHAHIPEAASTGISRAPQPLSPPAFPSRATMAHSSGSTTHIGSQQMAPPQQHSVDLHGYTGKPRGQRGPSPAANSGPRSPSLAPSSTPI